MNSCFFWPARLRLYATSNLVSLGFGRTPAYILSKKISDVTYVEKGNEDLLSIALKEASCEKDLLSHIDKHLKLMNNDHLLTSYERIFALRKDNKTGNSLSNLNASSSFKSLCDRIQNRVRYYPCDDIISLLKVSCYLQVPTNSILVQSLLQMLRYQVNQLTIQNIVYLEFLVSKLESCPLVEAFKIALPIVFETQLEFQLDSEKLSELASLLRYATDVKISDHSVEKIIARMLRFSDKVTVDIAVKILTILSSTKASYGNEAYLVKVAYESANLHFAKIPQSDLEKCIKKIGNVTSYEKKSLFYNETFFDNVCDRIVKENWEINSSIEILRKCAAVGHYNSKIMEYTSGLLTNPEFPSDHMFNMLKVLHCYSSLGFKCSALLPLLSSIEAMNNLEQGLRSLKSDYTLLALDLLSQSFLSPKVVDLAFQECQHQDRWGKKRGSTSAARLYQTILTQYPDYSGFLPEESMLDTRKGGVQYTKVSPLEGALVAGLGGHEYVKSNLVSRCGIPIDHVVAFREGRYPVSLRSDHRGQLSILDLDLAGEITIIAVIALYPSDMCRNRDIPRKYLQLDISNLESDNISVVATNVKKWSSMPDHEKIPFLMSQIREKLVICETISNGTVCGHER